MGTAMEEGVRPCQMSLSGNTNEHNKSDKSDKGDPKSTMADSGWGADSRVCLTSYEVDTDSHSRRPRILARLSHGAAGPHTIFNVHRSALGICLPLVSVSLQSLAGLSLADLTAPTRRC